MVESEAPETETEVLRRGTALLAERLPAGWSTRRVSGRDKWTDALIEISDARGKPATLVVEAKRVVEGRDVGRLRERLDVFAREFPRAQGLVVARYLSPPVRAKLTEAGISYVDATGNMRVEVDRPGLFLFDRGADSDPWRGPGRPRGTLKGEPAAKVVRAIADFAGAWTARELVEVSKASTGSTYRVVEFLEREGMAARGDDGRVSVADWTQVLRRWSDDYGFVRTNQVTRWIAPRGLPALMERICSSGDSARYAVSGTLAAAEWAAYAPARLAMIYVADAEQAGSLWDLRRADAGANVMLAQPKYEVVFERSATNADDVRVAAPSQVVVDLMTGPGRNPSEAEELLEWMKRNEQSWRT
ncbi:MAG: hypothetical protein F4Z58_05340 [Acidimicrobiaceae bacterium]|nr:hypothetical protein [Acidimicrobiaceae bacterium]MYD05970.1 hypothetical protein [Acidimicrobiaceae bacterium]MYI58635.1 hypothetical protein [Acidimicrobiaceae bacterium]